MQTVILVLFAALAVLAASVNGCDDTDSRCGGWASEGECDNNPRWMMRNCKAACNNCGACDDGDSRCGTWAAEGECDANPWWMLQNCKKACDNCDDTDGGGGGGGGDGGSGQIDAATREFIVNKHNTLRAGVQPTAANMLKMYWNSNLEGSASRYADQCPNGHDSSEERKESTGLGISVGQNLAWNYDSWETAIQGWYDEVKDFNYGGYPSGVTGHFTEMTRALTAHIGCGYKDCINNQWEKYYVCNYAYLQMGNNDPMLDETKRPWRSGAPCSECGGSCSNNLCDCGDKICKNGGTMNTSKCTCDCSALWKGDLCDQKNCPAKDGDGCGVWFNAGMCDIYYNVPEECPHMCGLC